MKELRGAFGQRVDPIAEIVLDLRRDDADGFTSFDGERFAVTVDGRPFVRTIAARSTNITGAGTPDISQPLEELREAV